MPRPKQNARRGPQLPFALQQKLGLPPPKKRRTHFDDRNQRRKDEREESEGPSKRRKLNGREPKRIESVKAFSDSEPEAEPPEIWDSDGSDPREDIPATAQNKTLKTSGKHNAPPSPSPSPTESYESESDDSSRGSREYSPEVVLDAMSKSFKDRQADEDAEILALEKKLGLKKKKKIFDDGFDDLLEDLEVAVDTKKNRHEEKEWLESKRRKSQATPAPDLDLDSDLSDNLLDKHDGSENTLDDVSVDSFDGFEDDGPNSEEDTSTARLKNIQVTKARENPYVAPAEVNGTGPKYVPPSRRKPPDASSEMLARLKRQVQGSLNKLSEANIISIVDEFDKLYSTNPRQDVNNVMIDLLLAAFAIPSSLQNTFIILHAAFVAAVYKIQGADFGAELLSRLVEAIDSHRQNATTSGKEALNLISLLANLFTFGVLSSTLVYDYIRLLLSDFGEDSAELLLRVMRDCGPQLRTDDPAALKGIVQMMNEVAAQKTREGHAINIRTRVMMDTITDLKNNKVRQATNNAGATGEHLTRMRKALGGLNSRQLRATEPLGISRSDVINSDKKGKWWLVGASWRGQEHNAPALPPTSTDSHSSQPRDTRLPGDIDDDEPLDYPTLFTHYKFTSPVHRSIFVAITSATDATDALQRLAKLRLTRKQELEIAPVVLRACRAEPSFNPYYGALSKLVLREKRYKMSFSIALWKFLEMLGEKSNDEDLSDRDDTDDAEVEVSEITNVARLYAHVICKGNLDLNVLKTLSIGMTKDNATLFLESLFITIFSSVSSEDKIVKIFSSVEHARAKSLAYFLKRTVKRSDLVHGKDQKSKIKRCVDMAIATLATADHDENSD